MATTINTYEDDDADAGLPLDPAGSVRRAESTVSWIRVVGLIAATLGLLSALSLPYVLLMGVDESWSHDMPTSVWLTTIFSLLTAGLSVLEVAGGTGAVSLRPWSRRALLAYAWPMLILGVLATPLFVPWLRPLTWENPAYDERPAPASYDVLALIPLAAWAVGTPFAVVLLAFFLRDSVRKAYARMRGAGAEPVAV